MISKISMKISGVADTPEELKEYLDMLTTIGKVYNYSITPDPTILVTRFGIEFEPFENRINEAINGIPLESFENNINEVINKVPLEPWFE